MAYPVYSPAELDSIKVIHHEPRTLADKWARWLVKTARWGFDLVSGYKVRFSCLPRAPVKARTADTGICTDAQHADSDAARAAANKDGKGENLSLQELRDQGYLMKRDDWMLRILFVRPVPPLSSALTPLTIVTAQLESIAGVPGFTAAMLRHLRSLRLMRRDGGALMPSISCCSNVTLKPTLSARTGWINGLLQEAENERSASCLSSDLSHGPAR